MVKKLIYFLVFVLTVSIFSTSHSQAAFAQRPSDVTVSVTEEECLNLEGFIGQMTEEQIDKLDECKILREQQKATADQNQEEADQSTADQVETDTATCTDPNKNGILGFPKWYKFLEVQRVDGSGGAAPICQPMIKGIDDIWLIVAAVIGILLHASSIIAVAMVIFAGITYVLSQGDPGKTKTSLKTIIYALVGLMISISSTAIVTWLAGRFK